MGYRYTAASNNKSGTTQVGAPLKVRKKQVFKIPRDTSVRTNVIKFLVLENTQRDTMRSNGPSKLQTSEIGFFSKKYFETFSSEKDS